MTSRRPSGFALAEALGEPGFTPRRADLPELLAILGGEDEELAEAALRVAARLGAEVVPAVEVALRDAGPPRRGRLARLAGRVAAAGDDRALGLLAALLADADSKTRRNAAIALGKVPAERAAAAGIEEALLGRLDAEPRAEIRRSLVEALGKTGGARALERLRRARQERPSDPELARVLDRAVLTAERTLGRPAESRLDPGASAAVPLELTLHCRAGLEAILVDELAADLAPRAAGPGRVRATLVGPLDRLFAARTWLRLGFPLPPGRGEPAEAVASVLASPEARTIFSTWTRGAVRFRLAWEGAGHRRALTWRTAAALAARAPGLVNDPTGSAWEARAHEAAGQIRVELVPRRLPDPRFAYRVGDVPAASHPTIAAALVRAAGVRPEEVVWDPFAGSGTEIVERALAGPWRALHATDLDPAALAVARENLAAAGIVGVSVAEADAVRHVVPGVTLVLTNPPMGRRVGFGDVGPLLDRFIDHIAGQLAVGGRLVWLSPLPARTLSRARRAGLRASRRQTVDMGGFTAELQILER